MAGTLNIPLLSVFNDKGVKDAMSSLGNLGNSLKSLGKAALGAYSGFQLLSKSIDFIGSSANAARDLQRNMAGVDTIFGASAAKMQEFISTSESMGMSNAQAAQAVTFLGSVFKQTGLPMGQVIDQTKTMVSLGADLASTYGYSVQEALTAMTATFRGEYDPIEKFGVAMKQQQVNAQLAAMGLGKLTGQALIAAQQQVRYNMILERTSDAQGAFSRNSGNLFEQQQILQAVFTDMQATLGGLLVPALTKLMGAISPLITTLAPHLAAGFTAISDAIMNTIPNVDEMTTGLTRVLDSLAMAIQIIAPLATTILPLLASNIVPILAFFAVFKATKFIAGIALTVGNMRALAIAQTQAAISAAAAAAAETAEAAGIAAVGVASAAAVPQVTALTIAMDANVVGLFALAIAGLVAAYIAMAPAADKAREAQAKLAAGLSVGTKNGFDASGNLIGSRASQFGTSQAAIDKAIADNNKRTQGAISSRYAAQAEAFKAQQDAAKQKKLLDDLSKIGQTPTVDKAQQAKADAARKKAAAAAAKAAKEAADAVKAIAAETKAGLQKVADDLKSAYDKMVTDAKAFTDSFASVTDAFKGLAATAPILGQFEQQTSDALQSLRDQAKSAFGKGLLGTDITADNALAELIKLVNGQETLLTDYARQRDVLAKKIDIARQISGSILSFGNITSALQQTKNQVIQTSTQIIEGVSVTISKSVDEIQTANLVGEYQKILDKTKAFATNLKALKAAGLDSGLFKQIVDAGVESGGATAAAIVAGGGSTITELNSLFADLQATGSDIAAATTDIMYANGGEIVNGFIDGLVSQDAKLMKAAADLASTFSVTFTNSIMAAIQAAVDAAKKLSDEAAYNAAKGSYDLTNYIMGATAGMSGAALTKQLAMLNGSDVSAPGSFMNSLGYMSASQQPGTTVNLTVDGKVLATSLLTYERTNGAIYVRAV